MNDGFELDKNISVFTVDERIYVTLIVPKEVADYFFNTTDRSEIYEIMAEAYNNRFDDDDLDLNNDD